MNSGILSPQLCYAAAIVGAFITALSQILLKKAADDTRYSEEYQRFIITLKDILNFFYSIIQHFYLPIILSEIAS